MGSLFGREPAMVMAALQSLLALAVGFGLSVSPEQIALILAAVAGVVGLIVRSRVSPVSGINQSGV